MQIAATPMPPPRLLELVRETAENPHAAGGEGIADGDRAAVGVC
jgi:hypothetical protein